MKLSILCRFSVIGLAVAFLAGCSSSKPTLCPGAAALVDASQMTVFREGMAADPSTALYTISIVKVSSNCDLTLARNKKTDVSSNTAMSVSFRATRAPNGIDARYSVPYFVAVTAGGKVLSKKEYAANFGFAPGQAVANFSVDIDSTKITVGKGMHSYNYQIFVGLQLTKTQFEYNKTIGRYGA